MKEEVQAARELFAEMAVQKGYCSRKDIDEAMQKQNEMEEKDHHHKMLGLILLQDGIIDNAQFINLLVDLDKIIHDKEA